LPRAVSVRPFSVWLRRRSGVGPGGLGPLLRFEEQAPNHQGCSIDTSIAQNVRRCLMTKQLHQLGLVASCLQLVQDLREPLFAHLSLTSVFKTMTDAELRAHYGRQEVEAATSVGIGD
jgi:hypothetical protein